jgi:hypothetical protein
MGFTTDENFPEILLFVIFILFLLFGSPPSPEGIDEGI